MVTRDPYSEKQVSSTYGVGPKEKADSQPLVASPVDRLAAHVIDYAIILFPIMLLAIAPFQRIASEGRLSEQEFKVAAAKALAFITVLGLLIAYQTLCVWLWRGTPGKLLMGLRIKSVNEEDVTLQKSLTRALLWLFSFMTFGLPFLAIFSHSMRRPIHDRVAETLVVTTRLGHGIGRPTTPEYAFVKGIYLFAFAVIVGFLYLFVSEKVSDLNSKAKLIAELEAEEVLCEAVTSALRDWPEGGTEESMRLDAALSLFGAGLVDLECLKAEVQSLYSLSDSSPILFLARAFIFSNNPVVSNEYLHKICEEHRDSSECAMSKLILNSNAESTENDLESDILAIFKKDTPEQISETFKKLKESKTVYSLLWASKELLRNEQFTLAEEFLNKIPSVQSLSSFVTMAKTKVLWASGKFREAEGAEKIAYSTLDPMYFSQLSSFMCRERLWESCSALESESCKSFSKLLNDYDDVLSDTIASLTYLKKEECESKSSINYEKILKQPISDEVRQLVEVLAEPGTDGFADFAETTTQSETIEGETMLRWAGRTNSPGMLRALRQDWLQKKSSLSWMKMGRVLFHRFMDLKAAEDALLVGRALVKNMGDVLDKSLLEDIVVASHANGIEELTQETLNVYMSHFPIQRDNTQSPSLRTPASQDQFSTILEQLLRKGNEGK